MKTITELAYAKINLHLDITGILQNGFHSVRTVMQTVSLCDTVTLTERKDGELTVECDDPTIPSGKDNLAYRAARAFCRELGRDVGADIFIEKRIPMAAGLAGGSADAAAVLRGMNTLCDSPMSQEQLCRIGSTLGSDIPFCIVGGATLAEGKGDLLSAFPRMPDCAIVIAKGGEGVSTPEAYGMLDSLYGGFVSPECHPPVSTLPLEKAISDGEVSAVANRIYNIFERPILSVRPVAAKIKSLMLKNGALGAMMSGSGPSIFGIFENTDAAQSAVTAIEQIGVKAHICRPV